MTISKCVEMDEETLDAIWERMKRKGGKMHFSLEEGGIAFVKGDRQIKIIPPEPEPELAPTYKPKPINKYIILVQVNPAELVRQTIDHLNKGYKFRGQPFTWESYVCQAMELEDED